MLSASRPRLEEREQGPTGAYLGEDGSVHFGAGLRVYGSEKRGVPQNTVRAVGEATASGTSHLFDDQWHDIAAVRRVLSDTTSTLEVWVDGRREALVEGVEGRGLTAARARWPCMTLQLEYLLVNY